MRIVKIGEGLIADEYTVLRSSKNTYRIIETLTGIHTVVPSKRAVFEFMESKGIYGFDIFDYTK